MEGYKMTQKSHWPETKNVNPPGNEPFAGGL